MATMISPGLEVVIRVNHLDVTGDFSPYLQQLTFTDHLKDRSDVLEVHLNDPGNLWQGKWYPVKGSTIEAAIGYAGAPLLQTGVHQVDEIEMSGPPDVVIIRGLATGVANGLRTLESRAFEGRSLRDLAQEIASRRGLTLIGEVPDLQFERRTQFRETDLGFLNRVGWELGVVFSVRGKQLVWHELERLEAAKAQLVVRKDQVTSYHLRDVTSKASAGADASYFDLDTKELLEGLIRQQGRKEGDVHRLRRRAESQAQVYRQVQQAMRAEHGWDREQSLVLPGNTRIRAGINLELQGWMALDGLWQVTRSRHSANHNGYRTEPTLRRLS